MNTKTNVVIEHDTFDVLDSYGRRTGRQHKNTYMHEHGLWHASAHIWIYDGEGHVLLQRRSHHTWNYPDCWDISSAGHLSAGENAKTASIREIKEELGLWVRPRDLQFIKRIRRMPWTEPYNQYHREYQYIYALKLPQTTQFTPNPLEVSAIRWAKLEELKRAAKDTKGTRYVPHGEYYEQVYEWLSQLSSK